MGPWNIIITSANARMDERKDFDTFSGDSQLNKSVPQFRAV